MRSIWQLKNWHYPRHYVVLMRQITVDQQRTGISSCYYCLLAVFSSLFSSDNSFVILYTNTASIKLKSNQPTNTMSRRNRSANFSSDDTKLFMRLIEKYRHVVDSKTIGTRPNEKKKSAWIHFAKVFNRLSTSGIVRDPQHLKGKWFNIKKLKRRSELHQTTSHTVAALDGTETDFVAEGNGESIDDSMDDPLDFRSGDSNESNDEIEKTNVIQTSNTSMSNNAVLNLLENFVVNLRQKCGRTSTVSNDTDTNYAVCDKNMFSNFQFTLQCN